MNQTKQLSISFSLAILLAALLPLVLFAQNNERATPDPADSNLERTNNSPINNNLPIGSGSRPISSPRPPSINNPIPREKNIEGDRPRPSEDNGHRPIVSPTHQDRPDEDNGHRPIVSPTHQDRPDEDNGHRPIVSPTHQDRPNLEARKILMQQQIENKRAELQSSQAERQIALTEKTQTRVANLATNISDRMQKAIDRLNQVISRIESRMEKLESNGIDTTPAKRYLTQAKIDLNNASTALAEIDLGVVLTVTSENPRATWSEVRTIYQTIHGLIKSAHTNIKNSVVTLKSVMANNSAEPVIEPRPTTKTE